MLFVRINLAFLTYSLFEANLRQVEAMLSHSGLKAGLRGQPGRFCPTGLAGFSGRGLEANLRQAEAS
jgi:hypothetical protein